MKRWLVLLAALVACKHETSRPAVTLVAPMPARVDATLRKPNAAVCDRILAEQKDVVARAMASSRAESAEDWKDVKDEDVLHDMTNPITCFAFADGAWAIELAGPIRVDPFARMLHGDIKPVLYLREQRFVWDDAFQAGYGEIVAKLASDYDGDGVPELYVALHTIGPEGGEGNDAKILTYARGAVAEYAKAPQWITGPPFDFDGDGRLDLPVSADVAIMPGAVCEYYKQYGEPADFVAHARPDGAFSTSDDAAKSYARQWCSSPPTAIGSPRDALCARLWAATSAQASASRSLVTSCVQWDCDLQARHKAQPKNASLDCDARRETYDQNVPFTLP